VDVNKLIELAQNNFPSAISLYLVYFVTNSLKEVLDRVANRLEAVEKAVQSCPKER